MSASDLQQLGRVIDLLQGMTPMPDLKFSYVNSFYRSPDRMTDSFQWFAPAVPTVPATVEEEPEMASTPRNVYEFAVIDETDYVESHLIIAESEQEARDEAVRKFVPANASVKDYEVVLMNSRALKARKG